MNQFDRQARIIENLRVKPISHGQVHTFQIAIPESQTEELSCGRREVLETSLNKHNSNLVPLIVRRTEAYSEEEEYEVVYGADWCIVARELDVEKLWVWVFDMTDEQAAAAKAEMEQLTGSSVSTSTELVVNQQTLEPVNLDRQFEILLDQRLKPITKKIDQLVSNYSSTGVENFKSRTEEVADISKQLMHTVHEALEPITAKVNQLELGQQEILEKISLGKSSKKKHTGTLDKINLNTAGSTQLEKVPKLGPAKVSAILKLRNQKGPFRSLTELTQVSGISQSMIAGLESHLICE